eukprot:TRINITY_DN99675_c0_g1_i1.p1 TRINITY_DN99675_c0_g1~~TRINITY_DN99675_c0_g1_i1.p1  ORF type:complete len:330 (-),score=69.49 TRINITY_DN99675_c0_g1_i1:72-1028(-)
MACWRGLCKHCKRPSTFQDHYVLEAEQLGDGSFGSVFLTTSRQSGVKYSVKVVRQLSSDAARRDSIANEVQLIQLASHPNIVRLLEMFESADTAYLVMELCSGGELFEGVVEAGSMSEKQACVLMKQICSTLSHLHARRICHRDLKPEHFLFACKGSLEETPLKLIDFGLACRFQAGEILKEPVGTVLYVAPEVLGQTYEPPACDLWSFGVIVYFILSGSHPFDGETAKHVAKNVRKAKFSVEEGSWSLVSTDAKDLVCQLLEKDTGTRITAAQALEHKWIREEAPQASGEALRVVQKLRAFTIESQRARRLCLTRRG